MIEMLSLVDLKKYYVKMYSELRNYVWDFKTISYLADLEIAVYRRFPDALEIRSKFDTLYMCIRDICDEDEDLSAAVTNFKNIINSSDQFYSRIDAPKEAGEL